jgi:hypothetical protein
MATKKDDPLLAGRTMIESMMTEARRTTSEVTFEDKLKLLDRWIKFQTLLQRQAMGGMGRGFDTDPDDND